MDNREMIRLLPSPFKLVLLRVTFWLEVASPPPKIIYTQHKDEYLFQNLKNIFSWTSGFYEHLFASVRSADCGGFDTLISMRFLAHSVEEEKVGREFCSTCDITWPVQIQMNRGW